MTTISRQAPENYTYTTIPAVFVPVSNTNGSIAYSAGIVTFSSATITAANSPPGATITVLSASHAGNNSNASGNPAGFVILTSGAGSLTYANPNGVTGDSGVTFGINLTVLQLFQLRTSTMTKTMFEFGATTTPGSSESAVNPGPYSRRVRSLGGGTIYVDTPWETCVPLALIANIAEQVPVCRLYSISPTAAASITDANVAI